MMKSAAGHGAFLLAALGLAAWVWSGADPESSATEKREVTLLDLKLSELSEVKATWPDGEATFTPPKTEGARWRVEHVSVTPPAPNVDAGPSHGDAGTPTPEAKETRRVFPASKSAMRSLKALAPLKARRTLGHMDDAELSKMGLKDPERTLRLQTKSGAHLFQLGNKTFGGQTRYVLDERGEVHLVTESTLAGLMGAASKLMERRLVDVDPEDVVTLTVQIGERSAAFTHVNREQRSQRYFAPKGEKEKRSEEAANLLADLRMLRAKTYLNAKEVAQASPVGTFEITLAEGPSLKGALLERADGYALRVGAWVAELPPARGREVVEDMTTVLP